MKYYLAPMEGITGYIYRNSYEKYFGNIDKYFTPFIVTNQSRSLKTKELRDVLPEN
ncbi:MAG: diguanylate cyclase, partial [Clostridium sp.]